MITKINHIGITVNNMDEALKLYTDVLGLKVKEIMEGPTIKVALIPVGESKIELIESSDPEGEFARHYEIKGEGLHHLALEVSNIQDALGTVVNKGVELIDEEPRRGAENSKIAFLRPKGAKVLIELVEPGE